jgi:putative FmdB family regulatory protein
MPIYDYRCDHCGHVFSAVQSFSDVALEKCPNCGKKPRRLISMPAIVFKGSGWYKTDSRPAEKTSEASSSSADKADKADKKGETKSETKTETKPETKTETKSEKKSETKAPEKAAPKSDAAS